MVTEFPSDLVRLQEDLLRVEAVYRQRIAALYGHPVMRDARDSGQLAEVAARLRTETRPVA